MRKKETKQAKQEKLVFPKGACGFAEIDGKAVRFEVAEPIGDSGDQEVFRTRKGSIINYNTADDTFQCFSDASSFRKSLNLAYQSDRELFVAAGGDLNKTVREV